MVLLWDNMEGVAVTTAAASTQSPGETCSGRGAKPPEYKSSYGGKYVVEYLIFVRLSL